MDLILISLIFGIVIFAAMTLRLIPLWVGGFLLSGHLKFWKKRPIGIEFAKHFRSHLGPIEGLAVSLLT